MPSIWQARANSRGNPLAMHSRRIMAIVVDAGLVYSILLIAAIATLLNGSSSLFIIISVVSFNYYLGWMVLTSNEAPGIHINYILRDHHSLYHC